MLFQSLGLNKAWFVTDTHSDKTTKPLIKASKQIIDVTKNGKDYCRNWY